MIGIGVVGCGYWGAHLIRNVAALKEARLVSVCDLCPERVAKVRERHPDVHGTVAYHELISHPEVDAVVVATPAATHFPVARASLQADKHVLVAKPLATSSEEARQLDAAAEDRGLTLMVGHTFIYSGAVRKIRQLVAEGALGDVLYYDSVRVNLGVFQPDVNVLWDLAVHDLSILDYLLDEQPVAVSATGTQHLDGQHANLAYLTLFYPGSMVAHMHVSWVAPVKVRRIQIGGSRQMLVYDDCKSEGKVSLYDKGFALRGPTDDPPADERPSEVVYRTGGVAVPECDAAEPLGTEMAHFVECVAEGRRPRSGARSGRRVISVLEAATRSLEQRGRLVELAPVGAADDSMPRRTVVADA